MQLSFLPPEPRKPLADPARDALWSVGLHALASLTGQRDGVARRLLGRLRDVAKDDAALVGLIERAVQERPSEPVPWLMASARLIAEGSTADDPWGLRAWYAAAPDSVRQWPLEEYEMLMQIADFPPSWRGSLAPLTAWVVDGYRLDSVAEVILAAPGSAHEWTAEPVLSLRFWDSIVRRRAPRWDAARCEWRVGG